MKNIKLKDNSDKHYYNSLMNHQKEAVISISNNKNGKVLLPTGTGKTHIEINTIIKDLYDNINKDYNNSYIFTSPRLLINNQTGIKLFSALSECVLTDKSIDIMFYRF